MNVNSVSFTGANQEAASTSKWSKLSKGKKAAIIGGAVVGTAAVASAVTAGMMGRKVDLGEVQGLKKVLKTFSEGYKEMGAKAAKLFKDTMNKIKPNNRDIIEFTPAEDLGDIAEEFNV